MFAATACGRIGFDPLGPAADGSSGDGSNMPPPGDAPGTTGDTAQPDMAVTACTAAIQVTVNQPFTTSTCATGTDLFDGCAGAALDEVVFEFVAPVAGGYSVRTFASGTTNIITTANVDAPCAASAGCFGLKQASMSQGQTTYFAVEASSGACQMIDFSITMP
jgi:hypothetical protein